MSDINEFASRSHYHFRISLRVTHPDMAPESITDAIEIAPKRSWKAGEPRRTPKGALLTGSNPTTFWVADMNSARWPSDINTAIHETLKGLACHRLFLHQIRAEGGVIELVIGWFFDNQSGDMLAHQCLGLAGDLLIDLHFVIYPPEQHSRS